MKREVKEMPIQRAKRNNQILEEVRGILKRIYYEFDCPMETTYTAGDEPSLLLDQITPWQHISDDIEGFGEISEAIGAAFGLGYVVGQLQDIPDLDYTPVVELMKEKRTLLYFPHKRPGQDKPAASGSRGGPGRRPAARGHEGRG